MQKKTEEYVLVIVESPGKIKKIESILGPGYVVVSSYGHILDLHPKRLSVDIENRFEPEYHIMTGKKKFDDKTQVVKDLIAKAKKASRVILAADCDREGEMIAWSYMTALGLKEDEYDRITFTSITKEDVKKAINKPSKIDSQMVDSQKTRRIMDRLVGFGISPKLVDILGIRNLSAGRVQSIVNKLICEKENEINSFLNRDQSSHHRINGFFLADKHKLKCELVPRSIKNENGNDDEDEGDNNDNDNDTETDNEKNKSVIAKYTDAERLMKLFTSSTFQIHDIIVKESSRHPTPPFTTSCIQQEASSKLKFPIKKTMSILQKLYESGYTTYLRTDSTNLSDDALNQCRDYICENFGSDYHNLTRYTNNKANTQEAHEAIRPVEIKKRKLPPSDKIGTDEQKIYDLVWNRTVASQMSHCKINVHNIYIATSKDKKYFFKTKIDDVLFSGYQAIYGIGTHGQSFDKMIEDFVFDVPKKKDFVVPSEIQSNEEYRNPPLRYSEAGLIKIMDPKNLNIGRPATYAEVINTIQERKYVEIKNVDGKEVDSRSIIWKSTNDLIYSDKKIYLGKENKKFCPTQLGKEVNDIMIKFFPDIMDYEFTSRLELQLDEIANGKLNWVDCLDSFWNKLDPLLKNINKEKKKERIIGKNPITGYQVTAMMGPYTPILKMHRSDKKSDIAVAPIKDPLTIDSITLEQALEILIYPKYLGLFGKKKVELKKGNKSFFISCGDITVSVNEETDPDSICLQDAVELLNAKNEKVQEKVKSYLFYKLDDNIEYIINNGKYGENNKYIMINDVKKKKRKTLFYPFPESEQINGLSFDHLKEIIEQCKNNKKMKKTKVIKK